MKNDPNTRIGIVGAGAAGLTAADALKNKGYKNVVILEREAFVGGKCRSIEYEGRTYEIGAGVIAENCHVIRKLAKKFDIEVLRANFIKEVFIDIETGQRTKEKVSITQMISHLLQLLTRYRKLANRFHNNKKPGLSHVDAEISIPFSEWAEKNRVTRVSKYLALFFTGFGYGYFDEVPAAYVLKHYSWGTVKSFIRKAIYRFPGGMQHLWTAVAKDHDVRLSVAIKSITRGEVVTVRTESEEFEFDSLILASPLDESLNYMDATDEERALFSKIDHIDYRTYAIRLKNFPTHDGYLQYNFTPPRKGHPLFWHYRYADSDLYTFYVMGDFKMSDEEVMKNIESVVHKVGGTLLGIHSVTRWKYFPHVNSEEMRNGYYDKLENLQGKNNTYFAGELMNFSTVELTAGYSQKLVERFF